MKRFILLAPVLVLLLAAVLLSNGDGLPEGKLRKEAKPATLKRWQRDFETKRDLVPGPTDAMLPRRGGVGATRGAGATPAPAPVDFTGTFRFGNYDYDVTIEQEGDRVTFRSDGVDRQVIGGAWVTVGTGVVRDGRIRARWWCFDLSRNYANNGGCEMWFHEGDRSRLYVRYYHDADETIEEGYGARKGTHQGERQEYRVRVRQPTKKYPDGFVVEGRVRGRDGEVLADAVVMLRHREETAVRTDADGRFTIRTIEVPAVLMVSAAAPGYRTAVEAILFQENRPLSFALEASPWYDDPSYEFVSPRRSRGQEIWNCGNCHRNSYDEWRGSRHAMAARSATFLAVYERDFLKWLAGPGQESGTDAGLCTACHAPQAALEAADEGGIARADEVEGIAVEGNHCDFCHKVHHVEDPAAPGVRGSLALGRPDPDDDSVPGRIKRVYGPLADSDYLFMGPVYNPFFATSALCAGCHQYEHEGLPALDTYAEWRRWGRGRAQLETCQTCHMPTGTSHEGKRLARRICINALRRPTEQIHDHSFQGRELAKTAVELTATSARDGDVLEVTTTVSTRGVGHKVPTGSADKHLLLILVAQDGQNGQGDLLPLVDGPRLPDHAGKSAAALGARLKAGDYAGLPGREFAQVLADADGNTHVPFWRAVRLVRDTRLSPDEPVATTHRFRLPAGAPARVRIRVVHRLRFKEHDVAAGVEGPGVRPLDLFIASETLRVR